MRFREIKEVREVKPIKKTSLTSEAAAIYAALFADDFDVAGAASIEAEHIDAQTEITANIADDFDPSKKIDTKIILAK